MLDIFSSIKSIVKIKKISIDNEVFWLHYKFTVLIFAGSSILITSKQFFGDPIDCIVDEISEKVIDSFCWIQSTYTMPKMVTGRIGLDIAHPGISGVPVGGWKAEDIKYHKYYQWVCFVLSFEAICFYVPRYLWKVWEGNRMRDLSADLKNPTLEDKALKKQKKFLVSYLTEHLNKHNFYAFRFFICEGLNLLNVIVQIVFLDHFLDGEFSTYGLDVWSMSTVDEGLRDDPMNRIFPKVTKCEFHKYGPSGGIQKYDALCVLPLNVLNEKIFMVLWYWLVGLAIITCASIVYRLAVFASPELRFQLLRLKSRTCDYNDIRFVFSRADIGDWLLLILLTKNIDPFTLRLVIRDLKQSIKKKEEREKLHGKDSSEQSYDGDDLEEGSEETSIEESTVVEQQT